METAMAIFDFLKRKPKEEEVKEEKPKTHKVKTKTPKEKATEAGEPYVNVVQVELDPDDVGNGAFELDWNDIFVARLIKAGFKGKDDAQIVDQWFQSICRNILNENFEQWEANQPVDTRPRRVDRNDIGNGRTEVS
jgi:hypothetical protein